MRFWILLFFVQLWEMETSGGDCVGSYQNEKPGLDGYDSGSGWQFCFLLQPPCFRHKTHCNFFNYFQPDTLGYNRVLCWRNEGVWPGGASTDNTYPSNSTHQAVQHKLRKMCTVDEFEQNSVDNTFFVICSKTDEQKHSAKISQIWEGTFWLFWCVCSVWPRSEVKIANENVLRLRHVSFKSVKFKTRIYNSNKKTTRIFSVSTVLKTCTIQN